MTNKEIQNLIDELERVKLYFGSYEGDEPNEITETCDKTIQVLLDLPDLPE